MRLGKLVYEGKEIWWEARADDKIISGLQERLEMLAMPYLARYATRDLII
jgi:hypothetical protein